MDNNSFLGYVITAESYQGNGEKVLVYFNDGKNVPWLIESVYAKIYKDEETVLNIYYQILDNTKLLSSVVAGTISIAEMAHTVKKLSISEGVFKELREKTAISKLDINDLDALGLKNKATFLKLKEPTLDS